MSGHMELPGTNQPSPGVVLSQMIGGGRVAQLLYVAAKLGIADLLKDGPKSSDELAQAAGVHPHALFRVLRALASLGVFVEQEEDCFALTSLAELLRSDVSGSLRGLALLFGEEWFWRSEGALLHSVKTGKTAFDHVHDMPLFTYMGQHPDAASIFDQAMTSLTTQEAAAVVATYDFSGITTLVDVGGGHGALLTAILQTYPHMHGILADLPSVVERAQHLQAVTDMQERCILAAGDFFQTVPEGGDAYILKSIIHNWNDEQAGVILRNCRRVMVEHGRLLLIERVIPSGNGPHPGKLLDIGMLMLTGGRERTEAEYVALLDVAGFTLTNIVPTQSPMSIVEGVPR